MLDGVMEYLYRHLFCIISFIQQILIGNLLCMCICIRIAYVFYCASTRENMITNKSPNTKSIVSVSPAYPAVTKLPQISVN